MSTALLTDLYELTMIQAARHARVAERECVFEVFTRSLPPGRRYGVFAGAGRVADALLDFRFTTRDIDFLHSTGRFTDDLLDFAREYRFTGHISAYREGEVFFPHSPVMRVEGTFEQCVILETLILSILNHDSAISSVGSRMIHAAAGRPCIDMGSRRVHEQSAIAAARAAAIVGFASTSNLEAGRTYGIDVVGTSAHAFTLLFDTEDDAIRAQLDSLGAGTSVLVDTFDIPTGVERAVTHAGTQLGGVRIDSGDLARTAHEVRSQLDSLGAHDTRITATSDLDEYKVYRLRDAPVDGYGIGTRLVTGGDHPAQGFVFKLAARANRLGDMEPVAKLSHAKATIAGAKRAYRVLRGDAAIAELVLSDHEAAAFEAHQGAALPEGVTARPLHTPLVRPEHPLSASEQFDRITAARKQHHESVRELARTDPHIVTGQDGDVILPVIHGLDALTDLLSHLTHEALFLPDKPTT